MIQYMSTKEAAEKWKISQRRVSVLCSENRIRDAAMLGNMWIIPRNAEKPADKEIKSQNPIKKKKLIKFDITIEEMISETFSVYAKSEKEAIEYTIKKYENGEFMLCPGNLVAKQMEVYDSENNTYSKWFEF